MNERKICFISCVNDDAVYREALYYIRQLHWPHGLSYECKAVRNALSMAEGYNASMRESDAKYKVYLHQDVQILEPHFPEKLLALFAQDAAVGMVGMAGSLDWPPRGVWWHAERKTGGVYQTKSGIPYLNQFGSPDEPPVQQAAALDGLLLATQYDLPWREDLFDDWHYYDLSQSCEFVRAGYKLLIPSAYENGAPNPWCLHYGRNGGVSRPWDLARECFLREYTDVPGLKV